MGRISLLLIGAFVLCADAAAQVPPQANYAATAQRKRGNKLIERCRSGRRAWSMSV